MSNIKFMGGRNKGSSIYNYVANIPNSEQLCITPQGQDGEMGLIGVANNVKKLNTYLDIIKGGPTSDVAMGTRYIHLTNALCTPYLKTSDGERPMTLSEIKGQYSAQCTNAVSQDPSLAIMSDGCGQCLRSIYINTTEGGGPVGGLIGSAITSAEKANPLGIVDSMFLGIAPKCYWNSLNTKNCPTGTNGGSIKNPCTTGIGSGFFIEDDIRSINPCYFEQDDTHTNPFTNATCNPSDGMTKVGLEPGKASWKTLSACPSTTSSNGGASTTVSWLEGFENLNKTPTTRE